MELRSEATYHRTVIVGSGLAGLTAALELGEATVVTAGELGAGASRLAQGGIAAALGPDDSAARHADDTRTVSGDLADSAVVEVVTAAAAERIRWLRRLGAAFDTDPGGQLALGREAGHSARRIVHADGDATGAAVMRTLVAAVRARDDIEVVEHARVVDLVRDGSRIHGVLLQGADGGARLLLADAVVLTTGGIGGVYAHTTNPPSAVGAGLAMARRAGARLRDPEFVQFHPTALATGHDPLPLLTEALRGAGATLIDAAGRRFVRDVHRDAELAPRDVVAHASWQAQQRGPIYLDARSIGDDFPARFPTVFEHARSAGLDPRVDPLPVTPAQHYHMGGVAADADGRTSLPGLFACGEVAATGLHGANRLASNSLLEALVVGARVARAIAGARPRRRPARRLQVPADTAALNGRDRPNDDPAAIDELRALMWRHGGIVRDGAGLAHALGQVAELAPRLRGGPDGRDLLAVAEVVLQAALARRESRGGHHRRDHPAPAAGAASPTLIDPLPVPHRRLEAAGVGRRSAAS